MTSNKPTPHVRRAHQQKMHSTKAAGMTPYEFQLLCDRREARKRKNHTLDPYRYED